MYLYSIRHTLYDVHVNNYARTIDMGKDFPISMKELQQSRFNELCILIKKYLWKKNPIKMKSDIVWKYLIQARGVIYYCVYSFKRYVTSTR